MLQKRSVAYDVKVTFRLRSTFLMIYYASIIAIPGFLFFKTKRILTFHKKVDSVGTMNKTSTNSFTIDWLDFRI